MATSLDGRKPLVKDLHEHIVCPLCRGYLIDATTLVECLHSFCRGCIVRRLGSGARVCPVCGAVTLPPLLPDLALQRLVYLAVPGLYRSELDRRRHFRMVNPQCPPPAPPLGGLSMTLDDAVSLSLCEILSNDQEENREDENEAKNEDEDEENSNRRQMRYLKCPAGVTVRHLVRLLALKRGWGDNEGKITLKRIEMLYENVNENNGKIEMRPLQSSWTLLDLACIFKWDKETPMKLFYRVVKREEKILVEPRAMSSYNIGSMAAAAAAADALDAAVPPPPPPPPPSGQNSSNAMENVQRPPTPPPSPKQPSNSEIRSAAQNSKSKSTCNPELSEPEIGGGVEQGEPEEEESAPPQAAGVPQAVHQIPSISNSDLIASGGCEINCSPAQSESHEKKVKKPRCEVTPVMRAPGPQGGSPAGVAATENNKTSKLPRLEHHKRRKRRNKRLIAEITTTPREDLLKLKVRLTPCPPRITSSTGSAKEKLLQMRAVRREKIKSNPAERAQTPPPVLTPVQTLGSTPSMPLTPPPSASADNKQPPIIAPATVMVVTVDDETPAKMKAGKIKDNTVFEQEETIEEIIDGIPDEVVRVAQNMNSNSAPTIPAVEEEKASTKSQGSVSGAAGAGAGIIVVELGGENSKKPEEVQSVAVQQKKLPELVIIDEDKIADKPKDEEVLRRLGLVAVSQASKSLTEKIRGSESGSGCGGGIDYHRESLERQLRESKANRVRSLLAEKQMRDALKSMMSKSSNNKTKGGASSNGGPKKGPPPLAPLTLKQRFSSPPKSSHPVNHPKIISRDASGATGKNETPLDLSSGANNALDLSPTPSSSGNPAITSTTFPSPVNNKARIKTGGAAGSQGKLGEDKKNQDLNLRTLSDAAVSLLTTNPGAVAAATAVELVQQRGITNSNILQSNKVALRIPQPHQRLSGFGNGMKIKPNLAVRHIPNPQAFVASQYRNQRTSFFTAQQQPP